MSRDPQPGVHVTYSRQYRRCNKADCPTCRGGGGHGPYWYAYWREEGRLRSRYLGRDTPSGASGTGAQIATQDEPAESIAAPEQHRRARREASRPNAHEIVAFPPLRVRTLGGFSVWIGDEPVPTAAWTRRKVAGLFKCLLSAPGQRLPRETALELLWPDEDPVTSGANLRLTLHRLRRVLGGEGRGAGYVRSEGDVLSLTSVGEPACEWLDTAAFERAAAAAMAGSDVSACRAALALYTGDYLPDDSCEEWAVTPRETLRRRYLELLLHLAGVHEAAGAVDEATRCLDSVMSVDPVHEPAARALMRLHASAGRTTEALRIYRRLAETLSAEFDLKPDLETRRQYRALLAAQAEADARRTNLPTPLTSFIGRDRELSALSGLLGRLPGAASSEAAGQPCRLVTLTGAGGCGKTRLAIELGRRLLDVYSDGVWIVELAALTDAALIIPEICRVLGIAGQTAQPPLKRLTEGLAGREMLLILDNCEHLVEACAALSAAVPAACPHVRILATSREALGVLGETVWKVPSLDVADPRRLPALSVLEHCPSVQLFIERARAVRPDFALTARNSRAVATIGHHLDGIPLAIELAAARLAALPIDDLAARLDDRFRLLAVGHRAVLPRHQTLRAVLGWSYALLDQAERVLLRRLAVFSGGWSLDAAEQICRGGEIDEADVADLLDRLVRKSLVNLDEGRIGPEICARYHLLETVRQYATGLAGAPDDQRAAKDAHLAWYLALATRAAGDLRGPERPSALARLDVEHDNLRAALAWCAGAGDNAADGLRLATELAPFWDWRGHLVEGRAWLERFLAACPAGDDDMAGARCIALSRAGMLAWRQGDTPAAIALIDEGLALARQLGDPAFLAGLTNGLGAIAKGRGEYDRAAALFEECMALERSVGNEEGVITALSNLGWVAHARGDYATATALAQECLTRSRTIGDAYLAGHALGNLAHAALERGEIDRAAALYRETLAAARDLGVSWGAPMCLEGLARVATRRGRPEQAARWWGAAAAIREEIGAPVPADDRSVHRYDQSIAAAQEQAGHDKFAAAWAAGRALSIEQAIAEALNTSC